MTSGSGTGPVRRYRTLSPAAVHRGPVRGRRFWHPALSTARWRGRARRHLSFPVRHPISAVLQAPMTVFRRFAAPISFTCFSSISGFEFFSSPSNKEIDMPTGTVKFFDNAKGYGFITNEAGGNDAFVHISAVEAAGMSTLEKEQRLSYELENGKGGKSSAVNLQTA